MQFSARPDLKSKRSAQQSYCSITIILSRRRDPAVIAAAAATYATLIPA
jgi:hypothetical protein